MNRIPHLAILGFLVFAILTSSCEKTDAVELQNNSSKNVKVKTKKSASGKTIVVQPFDDVPTGYLQYVEQEIKKHYPKVITRAPMAMPKEAYYRPNNRYKADSIIDFLRAQTPDNYVTMGITTKDISTSKGSYSDWGIMGLGFCPGKSCVASTFRLHGDNKLEKLVKVALHELGHTQGLEHCPQEGCLMRDAKGKDHLNQLNGFCKSCKQVMEKEGWDFKSGISH
jgi:archaemetzincin